MELHVCVYTMVIKFAFVRTSSIFVCSLSESIRWLVVSMMLTDIDVEALLLYCVLFPLKLQI